MQYQQYRNAIFAMWSVIKQDDFVMDSEPATEQSQEYALCGLCNPEFNAFQGRDKITPCPFDIRSEKDIDDKPCLDSCHIFVKGTPSHKLQIIMSKFMTKFITKEGIESLKSLAKACRGQKGASKDAAKDFVAIADKVILSTERFGSFEFQITNGKLGAQRRNE